MTDEQPSEVAWREVILADPEISGGKPIVRGTDLTVEGVLRDLAAGSTIAEMMERHQELTRDVMRAIFDLAAESVYRKYPGQTPDKLFNGPEWTVIES
ncbi:MAG TPA: DUF433 domain-containing protein [Thermomicrobiales bacterium]|nr:DUF433 domain-containing protein [Thermomicrobiales bacterium]